LLLQIKEVGRNKKIRLASSSDVFYILVWSTFREE